MTCFRSCVIFIYSTYSVLVIFDVKRCCWAQFLRLYTGSQKHFVAVVAADGYFPFFLFRCSDLHNFTEKVIYCCVSNLRSWSCHVVRRVAPRNVLEHFM